MGRPKGTHCKNGHEYTPENTVTRKGGRGTVERRCKICETDRRNRAEGKKRVARERKKDSWFF